MTTEVETGDGLKGTTGRIVVVGAPDSGKSTWIAERARERGGAAGVISGDSGQATVGAPGLLAALAPWSGKRDPAAESPSAVYYLGTARPDARGPEVIAGIGGLVRAAEHHCETIFVDTDGFVRAPHGRDHKLALVQALAPCSVVLLGNHPSLAPLARLLARTDGITVHRIEAGTARPRGPAERRQHRQAMLAQWLAAHTPAEVVFGRDELLAPGCGIGRPPEPATLAAVEEGAGEAPLHIEWSGHHLHLLLDWTMDAVTRQAVEAATGCRIHLHDVRAWRGRVIGDIRADGLSSGMGRVAGWARDPPRVIVSGRFLTTPGRIWRLGALVDAVAASSSSGAAEHATDDGPDRA